MLQTRTPNTKEPNKSKFEGLQQRDLTTRTYQVRADTLDEKTRSIEAVIATEAKVRVLDWSNFRIIEEVLLMEGCRIPKGEQVPMLDTHDRFTVQKQLGSTRQLRVEGDKLVGRNFFSSSEPAEHAWTLTREGHLKDNSVGYKVYRSVEIEPGKTKTVRGVEYTAGELPLRIATSWEIKENSVCAIGADGAAKNREESVIENRKDRQMEKFKEWLEARGLNYDDLSEKQRASLKTDFEAEQKRAEDEAARVSAADTLQSAEPAPGQRTEPDATPQRTDDEPPAVNPQQVAGDAVRAERERVNNIRALAGDDLDNEVVERCIREGKTVDQARELVLNAVRQNRPKVQAPGIMVPDRTVTREILENAMLLRAGYEDIVTEGDDGAERAEQAGRFRDLSMQDMCRQAILLDGQEIPAGREEMIRAAFSTASLPLLLSNVANKALLKGYNMQPETWQEWCTTGTATDFKTMTRARLTDTGSLEEVGSGGEVKYGGATEEGEQYSVSTYAKNFAITRQQIIDDDLQALTKQPRNMGARAKRLIGDLVYAHLMANGNMSDGVALFASGHGNLNTSVALTKDNLAAALVVFMKQTDKDGQNINVPVAVLLVPPDLFFTAAEIIKAATIVVAGDTDVVKPAYNAIADLNIRAVSESRLSNSSFTGYSATSWYLTGDKNLCDTIEVAFLNGRKEPTIERFPMGPDRMGITFRVFHDVGCKSMDHRSMQKNTA